MILTQGQKEHYVSQHAEHDAIVKLILKVAAMLCDGQHTGLQVSPFILDYFDIDSVAYRIT